MVKRMLIDATHLEETRVVIANGTRLDEFDFESSTKKQLKGNIYLAKVTRVEPSLQAAFVDFGGNRHGFLPFSEIHPDYYQIPVADRMALLAEQKRMGGYGDSDADFEPVTDHDHGDHGHDRGEQRDIPHAILAEPPTELFAIEPAGEARHADPYAGGEAAAPVSADPAPIDAEIEGEAQKRGADYAPATLFDAPSEVAGEGPVEETARTMPLANESNGQDVVSSVVIAGDASDAGDTIERGDSGDVAESAPAVAEGHLMEVRETPQNLEVVGGADEVEAEVEGAAAERRRGRMGRHRYKIQEVIKRRQILLVQVVKEERGNKGAALTTYLSLAGRYCVLMPNTARGGGISRKISSPADRKRLKSHLDELDIPEGMAVILRTAAVERSKTELKRDYEYLLRQWDEVRELTLKSIAPALVYEEANLIKRSIRDHYTKDVDEVLVEGDDGYRTAKEFMRMLMPSHAKKVQQYRDPEIPLFHRYQIESQLDAMHNPVVTLKSGGYIVINPTEALVAIDVNSGRATRERNIEETAYKTNVEAADEIARQLRLRDLAGLIVIDFIDMEESRNQHNVEKRLKDAMRVDRARIQIGKISAFGLLELSRQRLRPSFLEASTERCPHCEGTGLVRSTESAALHVIRAVEEEGIRRRSAEIRLVVPTTVALYILNHKRTALVTLEQRYGFHIVIDTDDTLIPPNFRLERLKAQTAPPPSLSIQAGPPQPEDESLTDADDDIVEDEEEREEQPVAAEEHGEPVEIEARGDEARPSGEPHDERRGRRSRRRRGGEDRDRGRNRHERPGQDRHERHERPAAAMTETGAAPDQMQEGIVVEGAGEASFGEPRPVETHAGEPLQGDDAARKRRRRGKRGGRRRRRHEDGTPDTGRMNVNGESQGGFPDDAQGESQGDASNTAGAQPDWQTPDDGAPQPPPRHDSEYRRESEHRHEPAPRHEPAQHERPAAAEHRGNGETYGASTPAPREATPRQPEPPAPAAPSQPEHGGPKRKGWWQRLTQ